MSDSTDVRGPDCMVDIETLDCFPPQSDAEAPAPFEVAMVTFDETDHYDEICVRIDPKELIDLGFDADLRTVFWHLENKNGIALGEAVRNGENPSEAARQIANFWNRNVSPLRAAGGGRFWAMGLDFDRTILRLLFMFTGVDIPWSYSNGYELRNVRRRSDAWGFDGSPSHSAIDDCHAQIQALRRVWEDEKN